MTAQQRYTAMINGIISPALRDQGMTGSAGQYALPSTTHWALLGFQKSVHSDRTAIRFTVNLTAVDRAVWADGATRNRYWGAKPIAGGGYGAAVASERIGLIAGRGDTWWVLGADDDPQAVADDVLHDLRLIGLPWLRAAIGDADASLLPEASPDRAPL